MFGDQRPHHVVEQRHPARVRTDPILGHQDRIADDIDNRDRREP